MMQKFRYKVITVSILFGMAVWVIDATIDYVAFYEGSFFDLLVFHIPSHELYVRSLMVLLFISFGYIVSGLKAKRQKAEKSLAATETKYYTLYNSIRDAILVADTDRRIIDCNQAFTQLFGYTLNELKGKKTRTVYSNDNDFEQLGKAIEKNIGNENFLYTVNYCKKNGDTFPGETNVFYYRDDAGNIIGFIGLIRDITEQKQAEDALRTSEEKYKALFYNTGAATCIFGDDAVITMCNKKFENLSGLPGSQIEGQMKWSDFVAEHDLQRMRQYHKKRSTGKTSPPSEYEFEFVDANGSRKDIYIQIAVNPKTKERIASLVDITARKKAEEQIENQLREKETLLKEIHHRVKNNMQVISSLLNLQAAKIEDEQTKQIFQESQNRIRSMGLIHEKLYDTEDLSHIQMCDYTNFLADYLYRIYKKDRKTLDIDVDCDNVFLDIKQAIPCGLILNELLSNSLKHAFQEKDNGKIVVQLAEKDSEYTLRVGDTGTGWPRHKDIKAIGSAGMGMHLVVTLVEQLEGHLSLEKTDELATVFHIRFPKKEDL